MYLLITMLLPLFVGVLFLTLTRKFNLAAFLISETGCVIFCLMGLHVAVQSSFKDREIWSSKIVSKSRDTVSCEHSYSCNCRTSCSGSGNSITCSTTCDTCYEHSHDYDWDLGTSSGENIEIDRVDRQGVYEPPRFSLAYVGEPAATSHLFDNYIKGNPKTVLSRFGAHVDPKLPVPAYPDQVYDYYRVDRFLPVGYLEPQYKTWNYLLNELNGELGPTKQVNVIIVAVKSANPDYEYAISEKWLGGKKNDLVVVLGVPEYPKISWVRIVSWTTAEDLKVTLRDELQDIGTMDRRDDVITSIGNNVKTKWKRHHMKDFAYLKAATAPSTSAVIFMSLTASVFVTIIALVVWFHEDDYTYQNRYIDYRKAKRKRI